LRGYIPGHYFDIRNSIGIFTDSCNVFPDLGDFRLQNASQKHDYFLNMRGCSSFPHASRQHQKIDKR
jgi:hypothetical protein